MAIVAPLLGDTDGNGTALGWRAIATNVLSLAIPNAVRMVLVLCNEVVNMLILSRSTSDPDAIAAVGLGNMMQNVFGLSIILGLLSAFDTFVSQAYGAGEHETTVVVLQRGRLVTTLQLLWIIPVLYCTESILCALGQDAFVAAYAGQYNRAAMFGLPCFVWQEAFRGFLANRSMVVPPLVVSIITSVLHVGWCAYFVLVCNLGNRGLGLANAVTWTLGFVLLSSYVLLTAENHGLDRKALMSTPRSAWHEWRSYLAVALPSTIQVGGEWWYFEIIALVVGYLGPVPLAAHVATLNYVAVVFMPVIGISSAGATVVGQAVGSNNLQNAHRSVAVSLVAALVVMSFVIVGSLCCKSMIARAYSQDVSTQATISMLLMIYFPFIGWLDSVQNVMGGIMRGFGLQSTALWIYVVCFYGVMLPLGCALAFPLGFGVAGVWYAMVVGLSLADLVFFALLCRTMKESRVIANSPPHLQRQRSTSSTSSYSHPLVSRQHVGVAP